MAATLQSVQRMYESSVRHLSVPEQLQLATLILERLQGPDESEFEELDGEELARLDRSIAQSKRGEGTPLNESFRRIHDRLNLPGAPR